MQPSTLELFLHIKEEAEFCLKQLADKSYDAFINDGVLSRAIIRSLEIIGEASKHVPPDFRNKYPLIEWKVMAGMRDRLIHHYFGIDYETVYATVKEDLPHLKEWVDIILDQEAK
ncbi:DUF86 domain-containing protein [Compostibacter hankyongensis]|uniref:DUF86 domain-containing protein n=1 Tax=Compostibacter hankyongensis TaxID=1007089 RepID=A0ABP8G4Y2_9BACT